MEQRALGRTGQEVSRVILGCGNFGGIGSAPALFGQGESEEEALALMDAAVSWPASRPSTRPTRTAAAAARPGLGRWLAAQRPAVASATKVFCSVDGRPRRPRARARAHPPPDRAASLERLGLERIDIYLTHEPDPDTPLADTLRALDGLVREGLVGAIGASNVDGAYSGGGARDLGAERAGAASSGCRTRTRCSTARPSRRCCRSAHEHGLGFTPFSPLAGGWLTGKYRRGEPHPEGSRMTLRPEPYAHLQTDAVFDGARGAGRGGGAARRPHVDARDRLGAVAPGRHRHRVRPAAAGAPVAVVSAVELSRARTATSSQLSSRCSRRSCLSAARNSLSFAGNASGSRRLATDSSLAGRRHTAGSVGLRERARPHATTTSSGCCRWTSASTSMADALAALARGEMLPAAALDRVAAGRAAGCSG